MTKEEIIWKQYKRFRRKYKQELPELFNPFVIACMEAWEKEIAYRKIIKRGQLMTDAIRILGEGYDKLSLKCTVEMLREQNRTSERVYLRRLACRMLHEQGFTLTQIGRVIKRNHCTVLYLLNHTGYKDKN